MQSTSTILIIEDEQILVDVLSKKLQQEGYTVVTAGDGEEGLRKFAQYSPNLILLDIVMPKMDGYEVLSALQQQYGKANMVPVIIISNSGQAVEIDKVISLGAKDYLIKAQFTPDEVLQKVRKYLQPAAKNGAAVSAEPPIRVLVVEDDQFLRDLLTTKLQKEKFDVMTAIDGPDGVEKIAKGKPEIVLLDIILPGIDGFEILKRVRSNAVATIAKTPVILLSNLGQEADVEKGRKLGADDYLIKSNFTIDEIIEKIHKLLAGKRGDK